MAERIRKKKANFQIRVFDLETDESRSVSFYDGKNNMDKIFTKVEKLVDEL